MKIAALIALTAMALSGQTGAQFPQLKDRFGFLTPGQPGTESVMHFFRGLETRARALATPAFPAPCSIRLIEVPIQTESRMPVLEPKPVPYMPEARLPAPPCPPHAETRY